jgi:hypothetical protein
LRGGSEKENDPQPGGGSTAARRVPGMSAPGASFVVLLALPYMVMVACFVSAAVITWREELI